MNEERPEFQTPPEYQQTHVPSYPVEAELPVTSDDKLWAVLSHLSSVVGLGVFGPLIIWLIKKEDSPFVEDQAKEALNFQLTVLIAALVCGASCILSPLVIVIGIGALVYAIVAALESNKGIAYRYPYTFRLIQ